MRIKQSVICFSMLALTGSVLGQGLSVTKDEQAFLDAFAGGTNTWVRVSQDIYATQSKGSKTVVYRNQGVRTYLAELNRTIEREAAKVLGTKDPAIAAAGEKYIDALLKEATELEASFEKPASASEKGIEYVPYGSNTICAFIPYAEAEFGYWPHIISTAYVKASFIPIGAGPQFFSAPQPTSMYRHVRAQMDNTSLGFPIIQTDSTYSLTDPLTVTANDSEYGPMNCELTSARTAWASGGICTGTEHGVSVTTRFCTDL
jgi:hypothetical protein